MSLEYVDAALLKRLFISATNHLEQNKATVDALNVFPVPDGDTGTNMTMTMLSASREVQKAPETTVAEVAEACAMGCLMGARGNSGVILSQLFRGFSQGLSGKKRASATDIAGALQEGVRTAYKAVMKPVEGTILTVARESAKAALLAARQGEDVLGVLEAARREADATLARTPDMLPILKKAGVVDSGGKGFTYVLEGYVEALRGAALDQGRPAAESPAVRSGKDTSPAERVQFDLDEEYDIRYPYDVELMIRGQGLLLDDIRHHLAPMGDSLLVVGNAELAKVHIHSGNPGPVLDYCVRQGTVFNIEIKNMQVQHEDLREHAGQEAGGATGARLDPAEGLMDATLDGLDVPAASPEEEAPAPAVVAVAAGDGMAEIFRSLGAAAVIEGGQTMNPSTEDLLNAVRQTGSRNVVLLPNNKNIILAAQQAKELAGDQTIHVVPTKAFPQGIAAMLAWQPDGDVERVVASMQRAAEAVRTGEVTYSVRDTAIGDLTIQKGDILGLAGGQIVTTGTSVASVAADVVARLMENGGEIITLYYGEGVTGEGASALAETVRSRFPEAEVEVHYGGQPLYYYLISVE